MAQLQSAFGLLVLAGIAWLFAERRDLITGHRLLRLLAAGFGLQILVALLLLKVPGSELLFAWLNGAVAAVQGATEAGASFVFGYLGGAEPPFEAGGAGSSFILAFRALPLILVMSALSSLLFYWRVLPLIVRALSWCLERAFGIGGALGVGLAANVFVGMVEAPLLIRPYLARLSRAELFTLMVCGMATIAGTVLALYARIIGPVVPDAAGHILTASLISLPAAILVSRLMVQDGAAAAETAGGLDDSLRPTSAMDAITTGTLSGVTLVINVTAMLLVLVALVHLANQVLGLLPEVDGAALTAQRILGWLFAPLAWLIGLPWEEAVRGGQLLGTKTVLNELLAYLELAGLPEDALSARSRLILTYALCGFANFGSLGIMIGGLATLAPERRREVVSLGLRSIVGGTLATCMTGAVVGLI